MDAIYATLDQNTRLFHSFQVHRSHPRTECQTSNRQGYFHAVCFYLSCRCSQCQALETLLQRDEDISVKSYTSSLTHLIENHRETNHFPFQKLRRQYSGCQYHFAPWVFIFFMVSSPNTYAVALTPQDNTGDDPNNTSNALEMLSTVFAHKNFNAISRTFMELVIDLFTYYMVAVWNCI